jgi:hypothetical protein
MDWLGRLWEVIPVPIALAVLAGLWRWLKPRRVLSFVAAVKEREAALAMATYWEGEAQREKESGLRWKTHYDRCQEELKRMDLYLDSRGGGT